MKVKILFRSGSEIEFHADTITKREDLDGSLGRLAWDSGQKTEGRAHLFWLGGNLDDIQAIVTVQEATE